MDVTVLGNGRAYICRCRERENRIFSPTIVYRDYGNTVSCRSLFSERHGQGNTPGEEISVIASGAAEEKRLPGMSMMAEL
jgi:hypothetical protein